MPLPQMTVHPDRIGGLSERSKNFFHTAQQDYDEQRMRSLLLKFDGSLNSLFSFFFPVTEFIYHQLI